MPSERSKKSAMVVPAVVEATMVAQYRKGWNFFAMVCHTTIATSTVRKIPVPIR